MPKVSVLLPVYNASSYILECVESVLNQTFKDFELILINDGSQDNSLEVISKIADKEKKIKLLNNNQNLGLISTLNKGISIASGQYIVRLDADDICLPNRLKKQVDFMDNKRSIGIAGSWIRFFGSQSHTLKLPQHNEFIKARLLFKPPIIHPSVIFRTEIFSKYSLSYNRNNLHAEDYGLWVDAFNYVEFANIPEALLRFRISDGSITNIARKDKESYYNVHKLIHEKMFSLLGLTSITEEDYEIHNFIACGNSMIDKKICIEQVLQWLNKIYNINLQTLLFKNKALSYSLTLSLFSTLKVYTRKELVEQLRHINKLNFYWLTPGFITLLRQRL